MVGLHSGTHLKLAVIGGVLTVAIADAFSDALGIHVSEESEHKHGPKEIWEATIATFATKFAFALTFLVPIFLLELSKAVVVSVIWGLSMLAVLSVAIARGQKISAWKMVLEHLAIAAVVIAITHYVGDWISLAFA
jgi:VIT1/CCC1 family predicted Fe2+/Mn2+ transporter